MGVRGECGCARPRRGGVHLRAAAVLACACPRAMGAGDCFTAWHGITAKRCGCGRRGARAIGGRVRGIRERAWPRTHHDPRWPFLDLMGWNIGGREIKIGQNRFRDPAPQTRRFLSVINYADKCFLVNCGNAQSGSLADALDEEFSLSSGCQPRASTTLHKPVPRWLTAAACVVGDNANVFVPNRWESCHGVFCGVRGRARLV